MEYTQEQIETIRKLASVFLPVTDIARVIGVEPPLLKADIRDYDSPARAAYMQGKSISKAQIRAQEMKLAKIGSPLGLESTARALTEMELDE